MNMRLYVFVVAVMLAIPSLAGAAKRAGFIPENFDVHGVVDSIDLAEGLVIVGDMAYQVGGNTRVHGKKAGTVNINSLRAGEYVGFDMESATSGIPYLYEVWVLPRNWQEEHADTDD